MEERLLILQSTESVNIVERSSRSLIELLLRTSHKDEDDMWQSEERWESFVVVLSLGL